jgi:thiosulfate/3-mercaptopyruvate sulfurtransferase
MDEPNLCLVDTRSTCEYAAGHLPGAIHLDIMNISLADTRKEAFDSFVAMMTGLFQARGIDLERSLVFYEGNSGYRVPRAWWFCRYLGAKNVRVLDGGLNAWIAAGFPQTKECISAKPVGFEPRQSPELTIRVEELVSLLDDPNTVILDTRSKEEYLGRNVRAARGGAIPGAINIEYLRAIGPDGRYLPHESLRDLYRRAGVVPEKTIVVYCQAGYRSSHTFLALESLGYPKIRNYIGSWKEWGDRTDLPIIVPTEQERDR